MAQETSLKLDVSILPSDFSLRRQRPPLRRRLQARKTPDIPRHSPTLSRSPLASYRPVYVRTYRYREKSIAPIVTKPERIAKVFRCFWDKLPYQEGRPEVREGSCLCECCGSLYLYGGLSKTVFSDVYVLKPNWDSWEHAVISGVEAETRYGHSMCERGTDIVVFGGAANANQKSQLRECFNTVRMLQPASGFEVSWRNFPTKGEVVEMRRYHAAVVVGRHLLVIGGMNQKNKVLSDCALLDFHSGEWSIVTFDEGPLALACHTAAAVIESYIPVKGVDDQILLEDSSQLQARGVYIFGGMDGHGLCSSSLRLVRPSLSGLSCSELLATGRPPAARCQHSMVFSRYHNVLVVFGGKSPETQFETAAVFRDLHVLDLVSLHWSQTIVGGHSPRARWAHSCGTLQDKIILFGGIEVSQFSTSETFILSLSGQTEAPVTLPVLSPISVRSKSASKVKIRQRTYVM